MVSIDKVSEKIAAFGIPGLIFLVAYGLTGLAGAAAITAALTAIGPGGIIGGIASLFAIGLLSEAITKYGFRALSKGVVKALMKKGETKESIINALNTKYKFISKDLKLYIKDLVDNYTETESENSE